MMRYKLESRLQDEGWQDTQQGYDFLDQAIDWAMQKDGVHWGMIRVIDTVKNEVVAEFPAVSAKEKQRPNLPRDKVDYSKKGDGMVRKEYIFAMLGAPIVRLEIDDGQYNEIADRVKRVVDVYRKRNVPEDILSILEEEGLLAHVKYAIGRIRAKYTHLPGADANLAMDGKDLVAEANAGIRWWYDMLESY